MFDSLRLNIFNKNLKFIVEPIEQQIDTSILQEPVVAYIYIYDTNLL